MRNLFIRYVNENHIIWRCSTSSNTQVIRKYSPQSGGTAETLIFWLGCRPLIRPCTYSSLARLGRRYKWLVAIIFSPLWARHLWPLPPPPPPAQGNVEDFDFKSVVPHSNHTVGTTSWQNHDSSPLQSVIILHCQGCLCLSNTYISYALWSERKSKMTAHLHVYPCPAQGLGWSSGHKWLMHNL